MNSSLLISTLFVAVAAVSWKVFTQRVANDVSEWELTEAQGRRQIFLYRVWSITLAGFGVMLAVSTLSAN
ncbi:hypothetical protein [Oleiharenicola lentus]|uniref:hypothetical protein n=1 Tax=Oleiharenicola lentus TaxID=2508720 RepID=UPI003F66D071